MPELLTAAPDPILSAPPGPQFRWKWAWGLALLAMGTRVPLAGRTLGEADGARYVLGLEQWLRRGPAAPWIYAKVLSPGYYALMAWLVVLTGGRQAVAVMAGASALAAIGTAVVVYAAGCRLVSSGVAATGTALFLLAPGMWWLGIEPHPQSLSFFCFAVALWAWLEAEGAGSWKWKLGAGLSLAAGLLLKNDLVLLCGIFPALGLRERGRRRRRALVEGVTMVVGAGVAFLLGRSLLLGQGWEQAQGQTNAALREFVAFPHGAELIKQVLPALTAYGVGTLGLVLTGLGLGLWRGPSWRRRWAGLVVAWAGPGCVFWLLVRGNNARHMAPYVLLPLWAALECMGVELMRKRWIWVAAAVVGLNLAAVPPSSNLTLYPSGDVVRSVADLRARSREMGAWLRSQLERARARGEGEPCVVGNATLPYMEQDLMGGEAGAGLETLAGAPTPAAAIALGNGMEARFVEVNNAAEYARVAAYCGPARVESLEYDGAGAHRRFLGMEAGSIPWLRRWYPAGRARLE